MKIGKRYSLGQPPKIAAHAVEWRRVLSVARSIGAYREEACVKNLEMISDSKKRVKKPHMRTYTTYDVYIQKNPLERTTRLARCPSPIIEKSARCDD